MRNLTKPERAIGLAAVIGLALGLAGVIWYAVEGKAVVGYGSYVPWGLWVAVYALMIGASGGAFLVYFLGSALRIPALRSLVPIALPVALGSLAGGLFAIWMDLGRLERFWHLFVFTNPTSVMGVMVWLYAAFGALLVTLLVLNHRRSIEDPLMRTLAWVGLGLFIAFGGAEGSLFGVVGAESLWAGGLTPVLFLAEGALAGVAAVLAAAAILGRLSLPGVAHILRPVVIGLVLAVLVLQFAKYSTALYAGTTSTSSAIETVLFGDVWWMFWLVYVGAGVVVPLALLLFAPQNRAVIGSAAALVTVTAIAPKLNLVIPSLTVPDFEGLRSAYVGPGLSFEYFPTLVEWLVTAGAVAIAALLFLIARAYLSVPAAAVKKGKDAPAATTPTAPV